jgi:hypothetical protein
MQRMLKTKLLLNFFMVSGISLLRNAVASAIKKSMGKEVYFNRDELFFLDYILFKLRLGPDVKLTSRSRREEGAGCQARRAMCAITLSRILGISYVHTPFSEIAHADRPMEAWTKAWEEHFNLGAGQEIAVGDPCEKHDFNGELLACFGFRNTIETLNTSYKEFQCKYYVNKEKRLNPDIAVSVHVRRGDVSKVSASGFYTDDSYIRNTISQLKQVMYKRGIKHHIKLFSEGEITDFEAFKSLGVELLISFDPLSTMRELIEADVLIMGKGHFSYVAAIISDGIVLCESGTWPLKDWQVLGPNGDFNGGRFTAALEALIQRKERAQSREFRCGFLSDVAHLT